MDPDFVFIVAYSCPRCHAPLEARASGPPTWLRCPSCGRACLPPEHTRRSPASFIDDETLIIGNFATGAAPLPIRPRQMAPLPSAHVPKTPTARLLLGTGFFLTTFLFVFSLLESSGARAAVFGLAAMVFLILLARPAGNSSDR